MSKAIFVMSTGRCSTQYLAKTLAEAAPDCVVEHEPIGPKYVPRKVFRQPRQFHKVLGANVKIQRKLCEIEDTIAKGTRYIDVGWPTYAWLPYLHGRFGAKFEYVHLVRNPFHTAASLLTHGLHAGGGGGFVRGAMIYGTDPKLAYPQFRDEFASFSAYEKCLFQWLELNSFLLESDQLSSFRGRYRFEDLYGAQTTLLGDLAAVLLGRPVPGLAQAAYDQVQRKLPTPIKIENSALVDEVMSLAVKLGYDAAELESSLDVDAMTERYSRTRLAA